MSEAIISGLAIDAEQKRLLYGAMANRPEEWGEAERIATRIAEIHDLSNFSGSEWVWETLAVLEAEGRLPTSAHKLCEGKYE